MLGRKPPGAMRPPLHVCTFGVQAPSRASKDAVVLGVAGNKGHRQVPRLPGCPSFPGTEPHPSRSLGKSCWEAWGGGMLETVPPAHYFCTAPKLRMLFMCLNRWEKIKRRIIFHNTWKIYKIQISGSINQVLLEHSHIYTSPAVYHCFLASCDRDCPYRRQV